MSVKHVKKYYHQIEKLYLELLEDLRGMEEDFKKGECTEEELQKLLTPVESLRQNYERLSYIMYLLYRPNKESKNVKYTKNNKELQGFFENKQLTADREIEKDIDDLKTFKQYVKEWKTHE